MIELGEPFTQQEISEALTAEFTAVHSFFANLAEDDFFAAPPEVWSPADNLVHLIKSCKAVLRGLKLPKMAIRLRFGTADHPSRSLAEVRQQYVDVALAGGAVAGGSFLPAVEQKTSEERERILTKWQSVGDEFVESVAKWSDVDLEKYTFPHPLLGDMTVREILFFTLYHNMHHVNDTQRLLALPVSEWFAPVHAP